MNDELEFLVLRALYENMRSYQRYLGIDNKEAHAAWNRMEENVEHVKMIDGGYPEDVPQIHYLMGEI